MKGLQEIRRLSGRVLRSDTTTFALLQTVLTQFVIIALNMMTGILTARLLGAAGRGIFAATTLWPQFLASLVFVGLPVAFVFCLRETPEKRGTTLTASLLLGLLLSSLAVAGGLIVVPLYMPNFSSDSVRLALFCVLGTYPVFFNTILRQALVGFGLFTANNVATCLSPLLYIITLLAVATTIGLTPANCAACLLLTILCTDIWMCWRILRVCRPRAEHLVGVMRGLVSYATRASVSDILSSLIGNIDRVILISFITPDDLGRYAVTFSFSRLIQILQVGVIMVLFPSMTGRPIAEVKVLHDHALRFMSYAIIPVLAVLLLIGPRLLALLYGREFGDITLLFDLLVAEAALSCISMVTVQLYMSTGNPGYVSAVQAMTFTVAVGGMLLLVPQFGVVGAASALLLSTVVKSVALWFGIVYRLHLGLPRLLPRHSDFVYLRERMS
jgi:antigen flippase